MRTRRRITFTATAAAVTLGGLTAVTGQANPADSAQPDAAEPAQPQLSAALDPGGESFVEDFDAGIDEGFWYVNDGYNNGGHQNCQFNAANATTADGILTLTLDDTAYGDRDYSCGAIQTNKRYSYGTYETRMKVGAASGTNSSLFSYVGPYHGQPHMEIDFEVLGKDPTVVELNTHVDGSNRGPWPVDIGYDSSEQWVDFAYVWEQHRIRYFIDGELVHTLTDPADIPTHNQFVFTMLWGTDTLSGWMGPFEYPGHPITTEYEYVAFTRAGEDCQFAGSVACDIDVQPPTSSFVDEFETLDTTRWGVSDGWNNGARQNCTWDADQVAVSDGVLNLTYVEQPTGDRDYACAEVQHKSKLGYGTYEVRMKGVPGSGVMSTFFTWVGATSSEPSEAIDIAKLLGVNTGQVKVNTWRNDQPLRPTLVDLSAPSDEVFHDYGMVWTADQLDFYVDGELSVSIINADRIPDRATNMFLNIWASETTPEMGDFVPPDGPLTMQVDRVAYTAPGDACQFAGSIACS
ncbi:family 16 glycosylhydrolase [Phytoactinopolyspora halotolerans]|uniref:licheninase n=1 Tax=Phytoactinopolyspora halotolerans TaxID=1981512 RepID=A0A6L9SAW3_9ACTN|nr:family 16 glycosylhydrolase [Phytoactinopolyspora halotolerans]NEE01648.1 family 16 glycosylhydrolase [Phytoactinopolyspora halotolerans]